MSKQFRIVEVGPRDGLQNEAKPVPLEIKKEFIRRLLKAGVREFEAGAFVRPDKIPQMADSEKILDGVSLNGAAAYFLVPNEKGLERALASGVSAIALFTGASETFVQKNIGMSIDQSLRVFETVAKLAQAAKIKVRGYLSVVWGCPYEGAVKIETVKRVAKALLEMGCFEVSLGDTIGVATPKTVEKVLRQLTKVPKKKLALHFHDTRGLAVANVLRAIQMGYRSFDSSAGGLGGCPYAPGAAGNVATEELVLLAEGLGFKTGLDALAVAHASQLIIDFLGRPPRSKAYQALLARG
ncbi:MAG TPA: hydroxymethylglutaryl-CoA lyase [candidate division Zixibacteria bacterium]|nr:hydroxymethylglutaryl-CoA lyase [candidate division Zixibacteria bacterium]